MDGAAMSPPEVKMTQLRYCENENANCIHGNSNHSLSIFKSISTPLHISSKNHQRTYTRRRRNSGRGARFNRGGGQQRYGGRFDSIELEKILTEATVILSTWYKKFLSEMVIPATDTISKLALNLETFLKVFATDTQVSIITTLALMANKRKAPHTPSTHILRMILDSGCTQHITNISKTALYNIKKVTSHIGTAGVSTLLSEATGDFSSLLNNVLHCPKAAYNLCSVGQLCDEEKTIVFTSSTATIYSSHGFYCGGTNIAEGTKRSSGLYTIDITSDDKTNCNAKQQLALAAHAVITNNCTRWHHALNHINIGAMRSLRAALNSKQRDSEIHWTDTEEKEFLQQVCIGCTNGKLHQAAVRATATNGVQGKNYTVTKPGDLILCDLFFSNVLSYKHRHSVGLIIVDAYSRCVFIRTMKTKSEAAEKFNDWIMEMKARGVIFRDVGTIRTDNGTEFKSQFRHVALSHKLNLEFVPPYTHVSAAERHIGVTKDNARAMIAANDMNLSRAARWMTDGKCQNPYVFWADAMTHSALVSQYSMSQRDPSKTKFELFFGHPPDFSRLKVFGCTAHSLKYNTTRETWDNTAVPGIYIGWNPSSPKTWKILRLNKAIVDTNTAIFDENSFLHQSHGVETHNIPDYNKNNTSLEDEPYFPAIAHHEPLADPNFLIWTFNAIPTDSDAQAATSSRQVYYDDENDDLEEEVNDSQQTAYLVTTRPQTSVVANLSECYYYYALLTSRKLLQSLFSTAPDDNPPLTIDQALTNDNWRQSLDKETASLKRNNILEIIERPAGTRLLGWNYVFRLKHEKKTNIKTYKARATLRGDHQKFGIDYDETYAPVARLKSLRMLLAKCATKDYHIHQMDVDTAFLNAKMDENDPPVYVRLPHGYYGDIPQHLHGKEVCGKLKKCVYGLKQAPRYWNRDLNQYLESLSFIKSAADPCIYTRIKNDHEVILFIYVDDLLIASSSMEAINEVKLELAAKWSMKDMGELSEILGIEIYRNREQKTIELNQSSYINSILEKFRHQDSKPASTPLDPGTKLSSQLEKNTPQDKESIFPYREAIGSIMYLMVCTRPDIAFAVGQLSKYNANPSKEHVAALKHLFRYLKGTPNLGITFGGPGAILQPIGFSDASYATDVDTRRSVTGYLFYYGGGPVVWKSKTQTSVALSSFESEYMALGSASPEAIHLQNFCADLDSTYIRQPVIIFEDNTACIAMTKNPVLHEKQKHIDVRFHFIRECVTESC